MRVFTDIVKRMVAVVHSDLVSLYNHGNHSNGLQLLINDKHRDLKAYVANNMNNKLTLSFTNTEYILHTRDCLVSNTA
jgi:hypothetical protein